MDIDTDKAEVLRQVRDIGRSCVPFWEGDVDTIISVLTTRDLLGSAAAAPPPQDCVARHLDDLCTACDG